jgi:uncharacterized membrane protein (TIGR02234 family)
VNEPAPAASALDRRGYALALVLLVVGAVLLLVAYGRTWATTTVGGSGLPTVTVALSGSDLTPAGTAIAVLALAGVAGLAAARRRGRVVVGVLLVLAGLAAAWVAVDFALSWSSSSGAGATIRAAVGERAGVDLEGARTTTTAWWLVAALAGLLVAAGGVLAVLRSRTWPEMGRRYERGGDGSRAPAATREPSAWDQLDQGIDPTDGPDRDTAGDPTLRSGDGA